MYSQKWSQINDYPLDYFELLYQYYAAAGIRLPVTYYSLDLSNSVHDSSVLMGGAYETTGEFSGYLWKKILMLPVYNMEQVNYIMNADETGVGFDNRQTTLFIPTSYEIRPIVHDFIMYDQIQQRDDPFDSPSELYEVVNIEKATASKISFWKLSLKGTSNISKNALEQQLCGDFTFVDYEKKIFRTSDAIHLTKQRLKNSIVGVNNFYKDRIGLYSDQLSE
jgi:hypothetical protein